MEGFHGGFQIQDVCLSLSQNQGLFVCEKIFIVEKCLVLPLSAVQHIRVVFRSVYAVVIAL